MKFGVVGVREKPGKNVRSSGSVECHDLSVPGVKQPRRIERLNFNGEFGEFAGVELTLLALVR